MKGKFAGGGGGGGGGEGGVWGFRGFDEGKFTLGLTLTLRICAAAFMLKRLSFFKGLS